MAYKLIKNGCLVFSKGYVEEDLLIQNDIITSGIGNIDNNNVEIIDASNCYVTSGLIDIHVHGGRGCNFLECSDKLIKILKTDLLKHGVTTFLPTIMSAPKEKMLKNIEFLTNYIQNQDKTLPEALYINLEGPFLSIEYRGIHQKEDLRQVNRDLLNELISNKVKIITIAPELDDNGDLVSSLVSRNIVVSIGHTSASYEQAIEAIDAGATLATHLFNGMISFHHRKPSLLPAILLKDSVYTEIIADGEHVHPAAIELVLKIKPLDKIILISDSIPLRDCPEMDYYIGKDKIFISGNKPVNANGVISGSILTIDKAVRNIVNWGLADFKTAIGFVTHNPAKLLGIETTHGNLSNGCKANIVLWDKTTLAIKATIINGECYWND